MKDKHMHVPEESALLKQIYSEVNQKLKMDNAHFLRFNLLKLLFYSSITLVLYASFFLIEQPVVFIITYILYGFFTVLLAFNFAHDLSHNTIFKKKSWNNIGFIFMYSLVGAHAEAWRYRHIHSHHYAPNVEEYDSDLQITSLIRVVPSSKYRWFHSFQHIYAPLAYTSYSLFWIFIKDFVLLFGSSENEKHKNLKYHISFWLQKIFYFTYILILPLLFSGFEWIIVITAFLMMHLFQSLFLLFTFFMTHHIEGMEYPETNEEGVIKSSWLMNQVKSSNDMHPFSPVANFVLGGFNNHIAHHLFPHIHHIYYPELNKILYPILVKHGVQPHYTTYFGGIVAHLKLLKKMSINPDKIKSTTILTGSSI